MTDYARWDVRDGLQVPAGLVDGPDWHRIEDTAGEVPTFYVRVGTAADGRMIVTGLLLAEPTEHALEVTANVLRAVSLAEVIRTIQWRESGSLPPRSVGAIGPTGLGRFEGHEANVRMAAQPVDAAPSRRGAHAPTQEDLERFADVYRRHATYSRSAMTLTARELNMHRATAHRWRERCRAAGLLPAREDHE
ncbi:hypothetical protein [Microbacterium profundi]